MRGCTGVCVCVCVFSENGMQAKGGRIYTGIEGQINIHHTRIGKLIKVIANPYKKITGCLCVCMFVLKDLANR